MAITCPFVDRNCTQECRAYAGDFCLLVPVSTPVQKYVPKQLAPKNPAFDCPKCGKQHAIKAHLVIHMRKCNGEETD